jgi:hypothetical protein
MRRYLLASTPIDLEIAEHSGGSFRKLLGLQTVEVCTPERIRDILRRAFDDKQEGHSPCMIIHTGSDNTIYAPCYPDAWSSDLEGEILTCDHRGIGLRSFNVPDVIEVYV